MRTSILFILICCANLFAQISQGGTPKYFEEEIQLDYIEVNRNNLVDRNFAPMVFQFGDEYQININVLEQPEPIIENGIYTYLFGVTSKDAYGIGFIFDDFYLLKYLTNF